VDVVTLSRLQFAVTVGFHFIFVPLTIGLALFTAITETAYVVTDDERYKRLARFWGKLFAINFVLGVVTGLTMEFQFGTNWARYAEFMGDIFGSPLAFEALTAFFLESTFVSIWIFGWKKLSKQAHAFAAWMIALGTHLSAVWIIVANGFMQHPVGYVVQNGRVEMVDFWAVLTNGYAWHTYVHTILSAYVVGGFFVLGISAYHLLRKRDVDVFRLSFRYAAIFALVGTLGVALSGHFNGQNVARLQPAKFAAMEAIWESESGVATHLLQVPDAKNERNLIDALPIPKLLSFLATDDANARITGLKEFPAEQRPPVAGTFWSFRVMVLVGLYMIALAAWAYYLDRKNRLLDSPRFLKLLLWAIPLPYLAINLGWMVAEVGRQPWTVYGMMTTANSVSPVPAAHVLLSLVGITAVYLLIVGLDIFFLVRTARNGLAPLTTHGRRHLAAAGD